MTNILVNSSGKAYLTSGNKVLAGKNLGTKTITENGTYAASSDSLDGYTSVTVNTISLNGDTLNVTPTTSAQTITPTAPKNGFTEVNVSAVTSSIDSNIKAANIKKNTQILGVTGTYETTKYGVSINNMFGDTISGELNRPTENFSLDLSSVTSMPIDYVLVYKFYKDNTITSINLSNLTSISGDHSCYYTFYSCTGLTSINLSKLTTVSSSQGCGHMFDGCSNITSITLSKLNTVSGSYSCAYMFNNCNALTSINLSNLTTVSSNYGCQYMFSGCNALTSINLSKLTTVSSTQGCGYMFSASSSSATTYLTSVSFPKLDTVTGSNAFNYCFRYRKALTSVSFPALTTSSFGSTNKNQFSNMLGSITGCTLHFPSNLSTVISGLTGYPNFGGTSTVISFDLTATS